MIIISYRRPVQQRHRTNADVSRVSEVIRQHRHIVCSSALCADITIFQIRFHYAGHHPTSVSETRLEMFQAIHLLSFPNLRYLRHNFYGSLQNSLQRAIKVFPNSTTYRSMIMALRGNQWKTFHFERKSVGWCRVSRLLLFLPAA